MVRTIGLHYATDPAATLSKRVASMHKDIWLTEAHVDTSDAGGMGWGAMLNVAAGSVA